jgi:hypothetical protein
MHNQDPRFLKDHVMTALHRLSSYFGSNGTLSLHPSLSGFYLRILFLASQPNQSNLVTCA